MIGLTSQKMTKKNIIHLSREVRGEVEEESSINLLMQNHHGFVTS
jgi:hypothetical protein